MADLMGIHCGGGVVSTPNPTHIIAEHGLQKWHVYTGPHIPRLHVTCWCGHTVEVESPQSNVNEARRLLGPHVVSKLTDAGYSIIGLSDVQVLAAVKQECSEYEAGEYSGIEYEFPEAIRTIVGPNAAAEGEKP